jgi:Tfp pilus assembly protein PilV
MSGPVYLQKNSFTIMETLISLIIVSVIISSFYSLTFELKTLTTYNKLNVLENTYAKNESITNANEFHFILH